MFKSRYWLLSASALLAGTAQAQDEQGSSAAAAATGAAVVTLDNSALETVVVTGTKDLQIVRDLPQSISTISGADLTRENAVNLDSITKRLANVKWNYGNSQTSNYSIRGVGKIGNNQAADPSVGINVDGVAYAYNPLASFNFFDIDTVEVRRGPQGTSYGKNSTLGALRITTRRPSFTRSTDFSIGFNQFQGQDYGDANGNVQATVATTGPLIDDVLAYRASLHVNKGGGFLVNNYNPDNNYINSDRVAARVQLLYEPSDVFNARLSLDIHPRNSENVNIGSTNFFNTPTPATYADGTPNPRSTDASTRLNRRWFLQNGDYSYQADFLSDRYISSDSQQGVVTGTNGVALDLQWQLADNYELRSVTGWRDYYFNAFRDDEGTVFDVQTAAGQNLKYRQITQEFRVTSEASEIVDWSAGIFLLDAKNTGISNAVFGGDAGAWFASNAQYSLLDADPAGRGLMENSLNVLWRQNGVQHIENRSAAIFGEANWHFGEKLTLTTGARLTREDRANTVSAGIVQQGYGAELNPVAVNGVALGGFASANNGSLVAGANSAEQLALADRVAQEYFGVATYGALTAAQRAQVGAAKGIRAAQIGVLWNPVVAEGFEETQPTWVVSPSYRINDDLVTYISWQHGEKAGIPQVVNGVSALVDAEENEVYELGLKSSWLQNKVLVNLALFHSEITNYQQAVRIYDEYTTNLNRVTNPQAEPSYVSATGNVPKVTVKGVEIDAVLNAIPHTQIRLAGAWNDARYTDFPNSAQPVENGNLSAPYRSVSDYVLPGAAKWTFDVGAEYFVPVLTNKEFHASINTAYSSRFNSDNALSSYGWIDDATLTDLSVGLAREDRSWDLTLYVKNVFNDDTYRNVTWNAYAPQLPRLYGLTLSGRF